MFLPQYILGRNKGYGMVWLAPWPCHKLTGWTPWLLEGDCSGGSRKRASSHTAGLWRCSECEAETDGRPLQDMSAVSGAVLLLCPDHAEVQHAQSTAQCIGHWIWMDIKHQRFICLLPIKIWRLLVTNIVFKNAHFYGCFMDVKWKFKILCSVYVKKKLASKGMYFC